MSKLTEALRGVGIYNPHNMTQDGHPMIWYRGRGWMGMTKVMLSIKGKSFPGHWTDNGDKSFSTGGLGGKEQAYKDAIAEAERLCPGVKMVKGPWRGVWVAEEDLKAAKAKVKEAAMKAKAGGA
jgi:hypothetical protein